MALSRTKLVAGLAALVLLCAGYFGWRLISITWHRYEMGVAYLGIPRAPHARDDYERHRAALIKLGYFTKQQFYLKRITTRSPEFSELLRNIETQFPTKTGKIEAHGYIYGEPTFLVIWLHASDLKTIEDFIKQADENQPAADVNAK
jgi:hypothetical protein